MENRRWELFRIPSHPSTGELLRGDSSFSYAVMPLNHPQKTGYYPEYNYYYLRPEVLESNFYAWRTTGDQKYQIRAATAMENFQEYLQIPTGGYAGIWDITQPDAKSHIDITESFWFAEVLKYLYAVLLEIVLFPRCLNLWLGTSLSTTQTTSVWMIVSCCLRFNLLKS